jgi:hypothetical protein
VPARRNRGAALKDPWHGGCLAGGHGVTPASRETIGRLRTALEVAEGDLELRRRLAALDAE